MWLSSVVLLLADPRGASGACVDQWDPILSFSHAFLPKSTLIRGRHPPMDQRPQWEIMDHPLVVDKLM